MILHADGVTVRYPGRPIDALTSVSCGVAAGELVAVVGPNGSGKTTLVRALLGVVYPRAGHCILLEKAVAEWGPTELAKVVAVVTQHEEQAFPLTVVESVTLGRYAQLGPLTPVGPNDRQAVARAMKRCDVDTLGDRVTDTLSGGEWQRVRIARALAQEPQLLILDEPTSDLDIRHEMEVFELVRRLVDGGTGALVITHQLNMAARYADRLVLLARGEVVAQGSPGDVLTTTTLERVFQWPVAVTKWRDGRPQVVPLRPGDGTGSP